MTGTPAGGLVVRAPRPEDFAPVVAQVNACHAAEGSSAPYTLGDLRFL